ncbi:hypothetical protein [Spartinivicinus poritis]|uniref:Sel1 repeat family protein n=1 Tax=Spartinivicinus poritis TaxID=2994640 RepID=A0ABT5UKK3_9GAMM|nr:hypothetical protein [Spartinivicinus sp. A2-2]MDE1465569.1 hypothetical protein [Spartinivicinus sp. A2-2]
MNNILILFFCCALSTIVSGKENCSLEAVGLTSKADIAQKLFYTGTCHYRNKDYEGAAASWEKLSVLEEVNPDYNNLQVDALNNLGYLKFFGYGVNTDKKLAIKFWEKAITLGQYESEYHLCHAYADSDEPTFDVAKAKKHCEKAYFIYNGIENKSEGQKEIFELVKKYRASIQ